MICSSFRLRAALTLAGLLFAAGLSAQKVPSLKALWQKVDSCEAAGLTRSAEQTVQRIYREAIRLQQPAEELKSCLYLLRYREQLQEEGDEKNLYWLDTLIRTSRSPAREVLLSIQAGEYWQYLRRNRWKLQQQTPLPAGESNEVSTWDLQQWYRAVADRFRASLDPAATGRLQRTPLEAFEAILEKGENTRHLRPTLYDLLAHRALEFFTGVYAEARQPAEYFLLGDSAVFAPVDAFIRHRFSGSNALSVQLEALRTLQEVLAFHRKDSRPDALLDADLMRLEFAYRFSTLPDKKERYRLALLQLENAWPQHPAVARCRYLRATLLVETDAAVKPASPLLPQALQLLEEAQSRFPGSEGGSLAAGLRQQLLQPTLGTEAEKVNLPGDPFRIRVEYKNVPRLYIRLLAVSAAEQYRIDRLPPEQRWEALRQLRPLKSWQQPLPDPGDYRTHSTEIKADALPAGAYVLLMSMQPGFSTEKNILVKQPVRVSNISYVYDKQHFFVLHRRTGRPLKGARIQAWENRYDYTNNRYDRVQAGNYETNEAGYFILPPGSSYRYLNLQVNWQGEELMTDDQVLSQVYNAYEQTPAGLSCHLFTDRAIYRPGQTVFFKGLVIRGAGSRTLRPQPAEQLSSTVLVRDANAQVILRIPVRTGAYGSYNGSFRLPEHLLNGQFQLQDSAANGWMGFQVEAYKRPRFRVEMQKPAAAFHLNDTVMIAGAATAFAGNPLGGARVSYRVIRRSLHRPWLEVITRGRKTIFPPGAEEETAVAAGLTSTDLRGAFSIPFPALPDPYQAADSSRQFRFEVHAEVTDINGETQSSQLYVALGYRSLQLGITALPGNTGDPSLTLTVQSSNLDEVPLTVPVRLQITALQSPGKFYRKRYWAVPDQWVMDSSSFRRAFPDDVYADEDQVEHYPRLGVVWESRDSSNHPLKIPLAGWKAGWYHLKAEGTDAGGLPVAAESYQYIGDPGTPDPALPLQWVLDKTVNPGDTLHSRLRTPFPDAWLIERFSFGDSALPFRQQELGAGKTLQQQWTVTEAHRGGIGIDYLVVYNNRVYTKYQAVEVPWAQRELQIRYSHFRSSFEPGAEAEWQITVSGEKALPATAELLATMYDASLDQFVQHGWSLPDLWPHTGFFPQWQLLQFSEERADVHTGELKPAVAPYPKTYDQLISGQRTVEVAYGIQTMRIRGQKTLDNEADKSAAPAPGMDAASLKKAQPDSSAPVAAPAPPVQIRKNFNETAFFYPALFTDSAGSVVIRARLPEALTQWKLMTLAHNRQLAMGYTEQRITTRKALMLQPNLPRLLREGDRLELPVKIVNQSPDELTGTVTLKLTDAVTGKPVDGWFKNVFPQQYFTAAAGSSTVLLFPVEVPLRFGSVLVCRLEASTSSLSDGEETLIPVSSNRQLITASLPLTVKGQGTRSFRFAPLLNSRESNTLTHFALTAEYSSRPAWYVVQALPWLAAQKDETADQLFNRCFAHTVAAQIIRQLPAIREQFRAWAAADSGSLRSNLERNPELKLALLEATPWVEEAGNETAQMAAIGRFFDSAAIRSQTAEALRQLAALQLPNGAFSWMPGSPGDRYMTQHILSGAGQLKRTGAWAALDDAAQSALQRMVEQAIAYADRAMLDDYQQLLKLQGQANKNQLNPLAIQYLYLRSLFPDIKPTPGTAKARAYYYKQARQFWRSQGILQQGMIALVLHREDDRNRAADIMRSLRENALYDEEMGMYWKAWRQAGWYWYQAPVESQALLIEAFAEAGNDAAAVDQLKIWLLRQKQTQRWRSSRATAAACYALLLEKASGNEKIRLEAPAPAVHIRLGDRLISSPATAADAGYFKVRLPGQEVQAGMGEVKVTVDAADTAAGGLSWGALYWQYFEDMDQVKSSASPLRITRTLYREVNGKTGLSLEPLTAAAPLRTGDRVRVRIVLQTDREMEYVHLQDTRAACFEPAETLSGYRYQGALGYYQSAGDAATHFYFGQLRRGKYVFEYPLLTVHAGDFSGGISSIQCIYAPEFSSNSAGSRVQVQAGEQP